MKKLFAIMFCLGLAAAAVIAADKANFNGTWAMDKIKSEGVPADMEQTMTVTQTEDTINQETKVVTDRGDQSVASAYVLDGKEVEYPVKRQIGDGKGKRTAKWNADGNGFEVNEEESVDTQNGQVVLKLTRKWTMGTDAKTLTIELDIDGPNGKQHTKRTFNKK